jgi:hypothetical protein
MSQPTESQYALAFSVLGTASAESDPLTGQPVSVTQTSLPWAAEMVWSRALEKREAPWLTSLGRVVVWKYG